MHAPTVTTAPERMERAAAPVPVAVAAPEHDQARAENRGLPAPQRWLLAAVVLISICWLWASSWDHPLYPPDEGRYASVSLHMAEHGDWLLPVFEDRVHLTKPPLVYWAQALCIRWLGATELAVRAPSLLASSLLVLATAGWGARLGGWRVGAMAAAVLCVMPIHVVVSRLAITDATLALFWFGTWAAGYCAVESGRSRWAVIMWACLALGLFAKGPVALTPLSVLLLWLALGRRWHRVAVLRPLIGLPLAAIPLLGWVALVVRADPRAADVWWDQIVGRVVGTGDHPEAVWFYLPIFLGGLFPATAMLILPGWNLPWRGAWTRLRAAGAGGLLALMVIVPMLMFSAMSGKLASYLLPLAAPLAILTAMTLERWLTGEADRPPVGTRSPEVVATLTICLALFPIGCVAAALIFEPSKVWMALPLIAMPLASAWLWMGWKPPRHQLARSNPAHHITPSPLHSLIPMRRAPRLVVLWLVILGTWLYVFEAENAIARPMSAASLLEQVKSATGLAEPMVVTYGFTDSTFTFYNQGRALRVRDPQELRQRMEEFGPALVLVAEQGHWAELADADPALPRQFESILTRRLWRGRDTQVLRHTAAIQ